MYVRKLLTAGMILFLVIAMFGFGPRSAIAAFSAGSTYQADVSDGDDPVQERDNSDNYFCQNLDVHHPVVDAIVNMYGDYDGDGELDVTYEEVMAWFCGDEENDGVGIGQIMLAFQTALATEDETDTYEDYLLKRVEQGWGQIWQDLDLIGRHKEAGPPEEVGPPEDAGRPEDAGPPESAGSPEGAGKPEWAGPPESAGPPEGAGKPEWAGPPESAGPPEGAGKPEWAGPPESAGPPEGAGKPEWAGPPESAGPPEGAGKPEWAGPPENAGPPEGAGRPEGAGHP